MPKNKKNDMNKNLGLCIPISRMRSILNEKGGKTKIKSCVPVVISAATGYIIKEILSAAVMEAEKNGNTKLTPENLQYAVRDNDRDMNNYLANCVFNNTSSLNLWGTHVSRGKRVPQNPRDKYYTDPKTGALGVDMTRVKRMRKESVQKMEARVEGRNKMKA
jgi:hypothetical protein